MSEMVERVARAIFEASGTPFTHWAMNAVGRKDFADLARAAIAAMREPTDEITKDGMIRLAVLRNGMQATREEAATVWRAMIDAALK